MLIALENVYKAGHKLLILLEVSFSPPLTCVYDSVGSSDSGGA
jgi:hypothetical protein